MQKIQNVTWQNWWHTNCLYLNKAMQDSITVLQCCMQRQGSSVAQFDGDHSKTRWEWFCIPISPPLFMPLSNDGLHMGASVKGLCGCVIISMINSHSEWWLLLTEQQVTPFLFRWLATAKDLFSMAWQPIKIKRILTHCHFAPCVYVTKQWAATNELIYLGSALLKPALLLWLSPITFISH